MKELGSIIKDINLGNAFLFLGVFAILVSLYIQCKEYTDLGLQIGLLTLFFGGVFRLLNMITKPFRNIELKIKKTENATPTNNETEKVTEYTDYKDIKHWKNLFRFTLWISLLLIYFIWINWILTEYIYQITIIPICLKFVYGMFFIITFLLIILTWYFHSKNK